MPHVFISYARKDASSFVDSLIDSLEESHFVVWTDRKIETGTPWRPAIDDAIRECFAMVVVITPKATESMYVTYEWSFAMGLSKPILPIIAKEIEAALHLKLEEINYIDFTKGQYESNVAHLVTDLITHRGSQTPKPTQDAIDGALRVAFSDSDPKRRREAIENLAVVTTDDIARNNALASLIEDAPLEQTRVHAALRLAQVSRYEDLRALSGLEEGLSSIDDITVSYTINALENYGPDHALDLLAEALLRLVKSLRGDEIRRVFGRWKDPRAVPVLVEDIVPPNNAQALDASIHALGEIGDESAVGGLLDLLDARSLKYEHITKTHENIVTGLSPESFRRNEKAARSGVH